MNIIDILIILLLAFGAFIGFMRGFFRELVSACGFIIAVILAFLFKNPVSSFLYSHLPFFKFGSLLKGAPVLNILLYEIIAFLIMLAIFVIIVEVIKFVTKLVELVLKLTIVLGIPSKILGAIVGLVEFYIITFIILYVLSMPINSFELLNSSKLRNPILTKTPLLSSFVDKSITIFNEFDELKDKYKDTSNEQFNNETVDLMLKYKIVSKNTIENLIKDKKIEVDQKILDKYKEE